jgi:hypothetical protein
VQDSSRWDEQAEADLDLHDEAVFHAVDDPVLGVEADQKIVTRTVVLVADPYMPASPEGD